MEVGRDDVSLLDALREDLGAVAVKDGCSPQGQCGCCTVLVDGAARVACVTPVRRVSGRDVRTVDGLDPAVKERLVGEFVARGASQCGFCTPGILCRLAALPAQPAAAEPQAIRAKVETALLAHLCRCTGWRTVVDAAVAALAGPPGASGRPPTDRGAAERRASLEGGQAQRTSAATVAGRAGFADDTAPAGSLVAVPDGRGGWAVGETLAEARALSGKVQGRRSGQPLRHPVGVPPGEWDLTLQTTWVEPAYLEPDASWCRPGAEPVSALANGGAFGAKRDSPAPAAARALADRHGRPVRVVLSREDTVRLGPKRPPVAAGLRLDGSGVVRLAAGSGVDLSGFAGLQVQEVVVPGPPVSSAIRAAGWAEAALLQAVAAAVAGGGDRVRVGDPGGGVAEARVDLDGAGWPVAVEVEVDAGDPLDEATLVSYVQGASHMALGWVCSEGIAVGDDGEPDDLTIRSFGVLRARDTPPIRVTWPSGAGGKPKRVSDAVFAAVAGATWLAQGLPPRWPTMRGARR